MWIFRGTSRNLDSPRWYSYLWEATTKKVETAKPSFGNMDNNRSQWAFAWSNCFKKQHHKTQLVYLPGYRSQVWSQQGFWQPRFCRKRNLWSLCFDARTKIKLLFIASMEKKKSEDKYILHPSSFPIHPFSSMKAVQRSTTQFPLKHKGFINYSSLVIKQVALNLPAKSAKIIPLRRLLVPTMKLHH